MPVKRRLDLVADGHDDRGLKDALSDGVLDRVRHGVYAPGPPPDPTNPAGRRRAHVRLLAATRPLIHPDSVVSHMSAAVLHGLPLRWADLARVSVTRAGSTHGRAGRAFVLHNSRLAGDEITAIEGFTVTTIERTVADLALTLPFEWGVAMADAALHAGADREALLAGLERYPRRPRIAQARRVIAFAHAAAESPAESISRANMSLAMIPLPHLQYEVRRGGVLVARSDFAWEEYGLIGEVDGKEKYGALLREGQTPADVLLAEKRREEELRQAGWWITRWGWDVACNRDALAAQLTRAFRVAARKAS